VVHSEFLQSDTCESGFQYVTDAGIIGTAVDEKECGEGEIEGGHATVLIPC